MAQSPLDKAIARRLQRDRENFGASPPGSSPLAARQSAGESPDERARLLDIERVHPNPEQARTDFPPESIAELAASLRRDGQLQPILVRPRPSASTSAASTWASSSAAGAAAESEAALQEFEIVMGERRWRAARSIGLQQIRATVRDIDDEEMLRLSLVENIQREDLNAVDRARTLLKLKQSSPGLHWHDIAADLGLSRQSINNLVALLKLPQDIQDDIRAGHLTEKHGRALRQLDGPQQKALSQQIKDDQISGEAALAHVRSLRSSTPSPAASPAASPAPNASEHSSTRASASLKSALEHLSQAQSAWPVEASEPEKRGLREQVEAAGKYLEALQARLGA